MAKSLLPPGATYEQAAEVLRNGRYRRYQHVRTVGNNTTLSREGHSGTIVLRLHGNAIYRWHSCGVVEFSLAGWNTHITRERLRHLLPHGYMVGTKSFVPYCFVYWWERVPWDYSVRKEDAIPLESDGWYRVLHLSDGKETLARIAEAYGGSCWWTWDLDSHDWC